MESATKWGALLVLASLFVVTLEAAAKFEAIEEWHLWKTEHGRQYSSATVSHDLTESKRLVLNQLNNIYFCLTACMMLNISFRKSWSVTLYGFPIRSTLKNTMLMLKCLDTLSR